MTHDHQSAAWHPIPSSPSTTTIVKTVPGCIPISSQDIPCEDTLWIPVIILPGNVKVQQAKNINKCRFSITIYPWVASCWSMCLWSLSSKRVLSSTARTIEFTSDWMAMCVCHNLPCMAWWHCRDATKPHLRPQISAPSMVLRTGSCCSLRWDGTGELQVL